MLHLVISLTHILQHSNVYIFILSRNHGNIYLPQLSFVTYLCVHSKFLCHRICSPFQYFFVLSICVFYFFVSCNVGLKLLSLEMVLLASY